MEKCDVIIAGAGLNGLAMALALGGVTSKSPLRIAVLDRADPRASSDARASALTAATQTMLESLGCWAGLQPHTEAMRRIAVHDGASGSLLSFLLDEGQSPAVLAENRFISGSLMAQIEQSPNITLQVGETVTGFHFGPGLARVSLASGASLKAPLIIGADGRSSAARAAAGIALKGWTYDQSALTFSISHAGPHGGLAQERFHAEGVFALLPLAGNRSSVVWTQNHAQAKHLQDLPEDDFNTLLQEKCGAELGAVKLDTARQVYPLSLQVAESFVGERLALVGDAAHVIHPLAGLGLNLGFKDAAALADCVLDAARLGQDIGGAAVLEAYVRWRRFDTIATAAMMDGLNRLFANDNAALKALRQVGLRMVDRIPAAKRAFAAEAAGTAGSLPRLMQGLSA